MRNFLAKLLLPLAIKVVSKIVSTMTPHIRKEIEEFVEKWEIDCKETENKIDDVAVQVVKGILNIKEYK